MKINSIAFKGNFLVTYPSKKARDSSELRIRCMDNEEDMYCQKINDNQLHIMTGKEAKDWEDMITIYQKCYFNRFVCGLKDAVDKTVNEHFLKKAIPLDFSKVRVDDNFTNACLKQLVKDNPDYKWLPEEAERIIKQ